MTAMTADEVKHERTHDQIQQLCQLAATKAHNDHKVAYFARLELLRMDYQQQPHVQQYLKHVNQLLKQIQQNSQSTQNTQQELQDYQDEHEEIFETLNLFDEARKHQGFNLKPIPASSFQRALCLLTVLTMFVFSAICDMILSPVTLLDIVLLKLGVPVAFHYNSAMQRGFMQMILFGAGVSVRTRGISKVKRFDENGHDNSRIFLYSHSSNIDSFILSSVAPLPIKFIAKKAIFSIPVLGLLMKLYGHIPIDRRDLQKAKESYAVCAKHMSERHVSIGIAPEGTRSRNGLFQDFKKGPFHCALATGVPVVPVIIRGAYELWPPGTFWMCPGLVDVIFLDEVSMDENETLENSMQKVRRAFLQGMAELEKDNWDWAGHKNKHFFFLHLPTVLVTLALLWSYFFSS